MTDNLVRPCTCTCTVVVRMTALCFGNVELCLSVIADRTGTPLLLPHVISKDIIDRAPFVPLSDNAATHTYRPGPPREAVRHGQAQ
jgi:hypothetical protein